MLEDPSPLLPNRKERKGGMSQGAFLFARSHPACRHSARHLLSAAARPSLPVPVPLPHRRGSAFHPASPARPRPLVARARPKLKASFFMRCGAQKDAERCTLRTRCSARILDDHHVQNVQCCAASAGHRGPLRVCLRAPTAGSMAGSLPTLFEPPTLFNTAPNNLSPSARDPLPWHSNNTELETLHVAPMCTRDAARPQNSKLLHPDIQGQALPRGPA